MLADSGERRGGGVAVLSVRLPQGVVGQAYIAACDHNAGSVDSLVFRALEAWFEQIEAKAIRQANKKQEVADA